MEQSYSPNFINYKPKDSCKAGISLHLFPKWDENMVISAQQ